MVTSSPVGVRPAGPEEQLLLLRLLARASGEATDLNQTLRAVLHAVCHATGWLFGQAWLPRADGAALECSPAWHAASPELASLRGALAGRTLRAGVGLAGAAWSSGQPQWRTRHGLPAQAKARGLTAAVALPAWSGEEVLAVLEFFGGDNAPADDERLRSLLLVVAAQVGALLQRMRLQQELEAQSRRLSELGQLKADFTAMVAHELGGSLAAIHRQAETLASGALGAEAQRAAVSTILSEVRLLTALVEDVQMAATTERDDFVVRLRPVRLAALLAEVAAYAHNLPGEHPLSVAPTSADLRARADPERIGQVLRNLLENAAKYSPPGTPIELRASRAGPRVRVEVVDHGLGIPPEDMTRIFEKFGRGRDALGRRVPGAGLGLYLSRRVVRAHGSDLTVASRPGAGAVFGFALEVVSR